MLKESDAGELKGLDAEQPKELDARQLNKLDAEQKRLRKYRKAFINQINLLNDISSWFLPLGTTLLVIFFSVGILLQFALTDLWLLTALLGGSVFVIFSGIICYTLIVIRHDRNILSPLRVFAHDDD